ncbi:hypothetical protein [Flavobacterium sp. SORGH_AS_0622]|uniref:hypothetical protein n=1 Tax=Flavobacterium sp. SORGH_AS_0622 TaxID=3041772 RepID=UPI00278B23FB|nr:hypothetical protein [Flavobacterium sp. SORGH_AS_0622]MDQ1166414.1 hypothetical protein [Flavobacterium sp. SORGH_AS_0622]
MEKEINLKAKNTPQLWILLSANILIILAVVFHAEFRDLQKDFDILFIFKSLGASIAPLILFLLNGFVSSHQKAILVFWKLKDPLPGSEAFSKLSRQDTRIDRKKLKQLYGILPKKPSEQNKLWYKIYKKHVSNLIISESHRAFLLARDLTSMCFLFVLFLGIPVLIIIESPTNISYFIYLILQYFFVVIGAKNRGRRFVTNVLAEETK